MDKPWFLKFHMSHDNKIYYSVERLHYYCTRMLQALQNKSWKQYSTEQQLYRHLPCISKTIQMGHCCRRKDKLISDVARRTPSHGRVSVSRRTKTYLPQFCTNIGCCLRELPEAMDDRDEWRERVREIRAPSAAWWWKLNSNKRLILKIIIGVW